MGPLQGRSGDTAEILEGRSGDTAEILEVSQKRYIVHKRLYLEES